MLIAINTKRNNQLYKSINVHNDLSLQETENNRWVVPPSMIENYGDYEEGEEVELIYVAPTKYLKKIHYQINNIIYKTSYFRLAKNNTNIQIKKSNKNHERVQNFIFNYLLENEEEIKFKISESVEKNLDNDFYSITLQELEPDFSKLDYEITLKDSDMKRRADIFFPIKNKTDIFGKGICIEVQLSSQKYEKTEERTLHRAYLGLSTVWIFKKDLEIEDKQIFLKNEELTIYPYIHTLNKNSEKARDVIRNEYERQGILIDNKLQEYKKIMFMFYPREGMVCPACKVGQLTIKTNSKEISFLGCTKYPNCNNTYSLIKGVHY